VNGLAIGVGFCAMAVWLLDLRDHRRLGIAPGFLLWAQLLTAAALVALGVAGGSDEDALAVLPVPLSVGHIIAMLFARMRLAQRVGEGEERR
jgi:hypothetical protein